MDETYNSRHYVVFNVSELYKINFNEVLETSIETVRKSVDKTKTFVKWEGTAPACVSNLTTKEGPYTHDQIVEILKTKEWGAIDYPYYYTQTSIGDTE